MSAEFAQAAFDDLAAALEHSSAQRAALVKACVQLIAYVRRVGGYMKPEDQAMVRWAEALVVEAGGSVEL